jgi:serine/threonine-protein kinase
MERSTQATDAALQRALSGTPYRYVGFIGSGGMATVVEAEHTGLAKRVVLKLLREDLCSRPDLVDRMRIEAQALARLKHPNLVEVYDFGVAESGRVFVAMERLHGRTLAAELAARGALPVREALELALSVLRGLTVAQEAGLVHRDIKPQNLFLCDGPGAKLVKVLDFGIAKVVDDAVLSGVLPPRFATQEGVSIGTPHYGAPEQLRGGVVSPATDVYAMGIVLYECVVGRHPFAELGTLAEVQHAQLVSMPRPPSSVAAQPLRPEMDRMILRAVAKAPADRFPDAAAFAREIEGVLTGVPRATLDTREAPTLHSAEAPPIETLRARADPSPPTLLSAQAPPALTVPIATTNAPAPPLLEPQTVLSLGATLPEGHVLPPPPRGAEVLGALALVAGFGNLLWHAAGLLLQVSQLVDPLAIITSARGTPPVAVTADVAFFMRASAVVQMFRHLMLALVGTGLVVVAIPIVKKQFGALSRIRGWSAWAFAVIGFAVLLDFALMALHAHVYSLVPSSIADNAMLEGVGVGIAIVFAIATPLVQVTIVGAFRYMAARLSRAGARVAAPARRA